MKQEENVGSSLFSPPSKLWNKRRKSWGCHDILNTCFVGATLRNDQLSNTEFDYLFSPEIRYRNDISYRFPGEYQARKRHKFLVPELTKSFSTFTEPTANIRENFTTFW